MYKNLRKARIVISLFIFLAITASFLFFVNRETSFFSWFLNLQFVPSLMGVFSGSLLFFGFLLLVTLLFGRVYCSTLCPLGTFQDMVIRIAALFKTKKGRRFSYKKPVSFFRYVVLSVTGLFFIAGFSLPLAYLDPYSNWGRISHEVINRSEQIIHNGFAYLFPESVFVRSYAEFTAVSFFFALFVLLLVILISSFRGRLYCNTICPVGALLGLVSRFSLFKPSMNSSKCTKCRLCVLKCKSQCIDLDSFTIDESRCVACLDCMTVCKNGGISYVFSYGKGSDKKDETTTQETKITPVSEKRRQALIAMGAFGGALVVKALNFRPAFSSTTKIKGIAPPGAVSIDHFKKNCTACYACISACPNNIIKPSKGEYGLEGIMLPVLDFDNHFCSYECSVCSSVCPNNALIPLTLEEKRLTQIGQARFFLERCIVHTDGTDCGACDEHCPTKAISMVPYGETGLYIPSLNEKLCIGCGGCEYICPASPDKAMIVDALAIHGKAQKPAEEKQEEIIVDEFGF